MRTIIKAMTVAAGLAVMVAPAVAQADQDVRDRPGLWARGMMGGGPALRVQNPGALLLERRDDLGLTDEQVRQIEAIRARVERENAPRIEQLRSVIGDVDIREMSVEERQQLRQQMRERMRELQPVREELRETNRAAGKEIHGLLTEQQLDRLRELRRERAAEFRARRGDREGAFPNRGDRRDRRGPAEGRRPHRGPPGGGF